MTVSTTSYQAAQRKGMLKSVDFSTIEGGDALAFFELYRQEDMAACERMLGTPPLAQEILATTHVAGHPVLVTRGAHSAAQLLQALQQRGEAMEPAPKPRKKSVDAWKIRSILGFGGQALQMTSSFLRPSRKVDTSVFVFAAANLAANTINLFYSKGEQVEDTHQLRYLKQRINRELSPHLAQGQQAIAVDDHRAALRPTAEPKPLEKAKAFIEHHSVAIGELGLRYLGAIGLAFPARGWGEALRNGRLPALNPSRFRVYTGLSSIFGKTIALGSKIPDPYNPHPPSLLDHIRERGTFMLGGLVEITSFGVMAYDCFFNSVGKNAGQGIMLNGKHYRDWMGGIGASMFVLGYIARLWAPFGERHVDMKELYAHASDMLAETPPEKTPQLLANTAASLSEHFDGKGPRFSEIYSNLIGDLKKFHALTEGRVAGKPAEVAGTPLSAPALVEKPTPVVSQVSHEARTAANEPVFAKQA